jgi:hypothetical protein
MSPLLNFLFRVFIVIWDSGTRLTGGVFSFGNKKNELRFEWKKLTEI